jgi:hypothetical protein
MLPFSSSLLMVATQASSYSSIALCSLPKLVTTQRDMMPPLLVLTGIMAKQTKTNYFKMTKWHLYTIVRQSAWCGFKDTVRWPLPEVAKHKFFLHLLALWAPWAPNLVCPHRCQFCCMPVDQIVASTIWWLHSIQLQLPEHDTVCVDACKRGCSGAALPWYCYTCDKWYQKSQGYLMLKWTEMSGSQRSKRFKCSNTPWKELVLVCKLFMNIHKQGRGQRGCCQTGVCKLLCNQVCKLVCQVCKLETQNPVKKYPVIKRDLCLTI